MEVLLSVQIRHRRHHLFFGLTTPGYVTTLCAVLFLGGITEMSIGILGEYIGRIYMESKDRPIYITKFSNFEEENKKEREELS